MRRWLPHDTVGIAGLGFFCFATHDALSKLVATQTSPTVTAFLEQLFVLLYVVGWALFANRPDTFRPQSIRNMLVCTLCSLGGMLGFYFAVTHIAFVDLFIIILLRPIVSLLMIRLWLKERITPWQIAAIVCGSTAACVTFQIWDSALFTHPPHDLLVGIAGGLLNVVSMSVRYVWIKKFSATESPACFSFYASLAMLALIPFLLPATTAIVWPSAPLLGASALAAVFYVVGSVILVIANQRGTVAPLASMQYTMLIWIVLYGWALFGEVPGTPSIIGAILTALSGALIYLDAYLKERRVPDLSPALAQTK